MPEPQVSRWPQIVGLAAGLTLLLTTLLVAFGLPAVNTAPRDVPLAVAAPEPVAAQVSAALQQAQPGAFELVTAESADAARQLILDREVYGALVVGGDGPQVFVASAASPVVAQAITAVGEGLGAAQGVTPTVTDVAPLPADDPRGVGLSAGALPIALGGLMAGVAISLLVAGTWRRVGAMLTFAVLSGFTMTAVLQFWFGTFTANFLLTSLAATLGVMATGMTVLGLEQLLGRVGIGLAALIIVVLGNPLSGLASAPEMLPQPWGAIGQALPPGATGTLLRNVAYFDGAAIIRPLLVLAGWLLLGLLAFWAGTTRTARAKTEPAAATAEQARGSRAHRQAAGGRHPRVRILGGVRAYCGDLRTGTAPAQHVARPLPR